jgi:hypothetical protein
MLKKVARLGSGLDTEFSGISGAALGEKTAALTTLAQALSKSADMEKRVEGVGTHAENLEDENTEKDLHSKWLKVVAPKALSDYKKISSEDIKSLAAHELPEVLATLTDHGIILTTPEFLDLVFQKMTGGPAPAGMAEKLVSYQAELFSKLSERPDLIASVIKSGAVAIPGVTPTSAAVSNKVAKYDSSRSLKEAWITKRAFNLPGHVTYTDPGTGAKYVSTAEELGRAKKYDQKGEAASLVGAAAMSLITYKALSALLGVKGALGRVATLLGAGAAGGGTYNVLAGDKTPRVTHQGQPIPPGALFRQVGGATKSPTIPQHSNASSGDGDGLGSWVLPTALLADRMLAGGPSVVKSASIKLPSALDSDSIDFNLYSKKLGEALLKTTR